MERHLLLTVSEQQSAFCGVRFLGSFFANKQDLRITLFYTAPKPAAVWKDEQSRDTEEHAKQQAHRIEARGREAIEAARVMLCRLGFPEEKIESKLTFRKHSKVKDIIHEGTAGRYDAVVLGRRGLSWLEEVFSESVSKELLGTRVNFPLWFCRKPKESCRDVLVCLDGSESAFRMADHVGFMLAPEPDHLIRLLVVRSGRLSSDPDPDTIFATARSHLIENGFPAEKVATKVVDDSNAARAILKELESVSYGTVAVGRGDPDRGFFMGSVCEKLFREVEQTAMWISY
ncbi:MAG: universal stress protein [Planctomycetota bacterium]